MTLTEMAAMGGQILTYVWNGIDNPVPWFDNYSLLDILLALLAWGIAWKFIKRMINANRETISNRINKSKNHNMYKDNIQKR